MDTDNEQEEGDQQGGAAEQGPLHRRAPPSLRPIRLNEQEKQSALRISGPFVTEAVMGQEVPDAYIYLAYESFLRQEISPVEVQNQAIWVSELNSLFNEQGRFEMISRAGVGSPFLDQMFHMLKLANLHHRDYNLMVGTVFFDDSERHLNLIKRMVFAVRYQGFDSSVIIRKIVRSWRDGFWFRIPTKD